MNDMISDTQPGGMPSAGMSPDGTPIAPPPSTAEALVGVLTAPSSTFKALAARPTWSFLAPLVILLIVATLSNFFFMKRADMEQVIRTQIRQSPNSAQMTQANMDQAVQMGLKIAKYSMYFSFVIMPIFLVVMALIFWLAILISGERITFGNCFRVICWGQIPRALSLLLFILIIFLKDPTYIDPGNPIMSNLGAILGLDRLGKPLYALLSDLDIFAVWTLWLYSVGFAAFAKSKTGKMAGVVFGLYAIYIAGHVAFKAIF